MTRSGTRRGASAKPVQARVRGGAPPGALGDIDTQLMLQVREGSADAANALVRRNFARVSRYIARVVRDWRSVEDLAQDVFLQVLKNAEHYEPAARFSTWLYRIATNTALNHLNQAYVKKRRNPNPDLAEPDVADRSGSAPEQQMSLNELRTSVSAAIHSLPVKQRIALTLFQYEELSYEQIAAVLDTTVESVRCLLKRARHTLRERLSGLM